MIHVLSAALCLILHRLWRAASRPFLGVGCSRLPSRCLRKNARLSQARFHSTPCDPPCFNVGGSETRSASNCEINARFCRRVLSLSRNIEIRGKGCCYSALFVVSAIGRFFRKHRAAPTISRRGHLQNAGGFVRRFGPVSTVRVRVFGFNFAAIFARGGLSVRQDPPLPQWARCRLQRSISPCVRRRGGGEHSG